MAQMQEKNDVAALQRLIPLNTLEDEALQQILDQAAFERVRRGDYIFKEGDNNQERVYLLSGEVVLLEGKSEVEKVAAGGTAARYPLAHTLPRKYSARVQTAVEVLRVDNQLLNELLAKSNASTYEVEELDQEACDDWMSQLLQSPIFQRIPAANIQNVIMRMEEFHVDAGDLVIQEGTGGDDDDFFYLINKGHCSISRVGVSGDSEELARLGPGDSFGEEALLADRPRGSSVTMLTPGVLLRLKKCDFVEYIKRPLANAIDLEEAQHKVGEGALWLDVRSQSEYEESHIIDSVNIPFTALRAQLDGLDHDASYVVYCQDGHLSSTAVFLLVEQGIDAHVLAKGVELISDELLYRKPFEDTLSEMVEEPGGGDGSIDADSQSLLDDISVLEARVKKAEGQARNYFNQSKKFHKLLETVKQRLDGAIKGQEKARAEAHRLTDELAERNEAIGQLRLELAGVNDRARETEDQLRELKRHENEHNANEGDKVLRAELESLTEALDESDNAYEEAQEKIKTLEAECKKKDQEIAKLKG